MTNKEYRETNHGPGIQRAIMFMEDVMSGQAFARETLQAMAEALVARSCENPSPVALVDDVEQALTDYSHALIHALIERLDL